MAAVENDHEGLLFFNQLSGRLHIRLSEPTKPIAEKLLNQAAPPSAQIEEISLSLQVVEDIEEDDIRDLTDEEWTRVVLRAPVIRLRGMDERVVEHRAPDGKAFTVRDLTAAIAETERQTRGATNWFGGVDVHHVYFCGLQREDDEVWSIGWGS